MSQYNHYYGPIRQHNDMPSTNLQLLQEEVKQLRDSVKKLTEMVEAMWDAPGMPGANAIMEECQKEGLDTPFSEEQLGL